MKQTLSSDHLHFLDDDQQQQKSSNSTSTSNINEINTKIQG